MTADDTAPANDTAPADNTAPTNDTALADMAGALAAATGDESLLSAGITATTRLEGDLCLDSLDVAALGAVLRDRYGTTVDLAGYVADLDIDQIIGLTVGDIAAYVDRCLR